MLSESTEKKFGYTPEQISSGSRKPIIFRCEFCYQEFTATKKSVSRSRFPTCGNCNLRGAI